ncbi:CppA N-terminal domain-containing protein [Streptococcus pacificus]|uniref:VOC family protein n=1 Tax=Streptococcus pacificus TaxID=2740577 RepID=A0ABS0ZJV7_9STRE|nr:CppA N-terminal domain-containing protein [Streptococcus pacificus]MBJ8326247.1 VOC family protein [Streptococcus pacificus]
MALFDHIKFKTPVLRVNNRDENIKFYQEHLGLRLLSEENALAFFGSLERAETIFTIEESPAMRTRAVNGPKKLHKVVLKVKKKEDIDALLANGADAKRVYQGNNGYAFEIFSPENDLILIHAEDDLSSLKLVDRPAFEQDKTFTGLLDYTIEEIILNVPDLKKAKTFYQEILANELPLKIDFVQNEGKDLTIEPHIAWDIEILEFSVPSDYDLSFLSNHLKENGLSIFLDKKQKVLVVSDHSNIEIWFVKE